MSKKKCPYFKADCIESECGIWDEGLDCCSMVSIALGNWSIRSMGATKKKLKHENPKLSTAKDWLLRSGLVVGTAFFLAYGINSFVKTGDVVGFILAPMVTGTFWYWLIKGLFDDSKIKDR